jgi:AmmeMemoRadiSam system protein B
LESEDRKGVMKASVRHPAVAGLFYPLDGSELRADVENMLTAAQPSDSPVRSRILIVPHAGYVYSGPIAASGYRLLPGVGGLRKIVMLGPSHYTAFSGLALPGVDVMKTPLGEVAVEPESTARLLADPLVEDLPEAHRREHSLEVQLPFLQIVAPAVPIVPLLTGAIDPAAASVVVEPLLDDGTLLVVSSDLSHYHDAATARRLDTDTVEAIERLDPDGIGPRAACGRAGIQIALHIAARRGYRAEVLDLRNSADTAGGPDRVVGYPAIVLGERRPGV